MSNPLNSFDYPQSPGNEPQTVSDATNIHHNLVRGMHDVMIGYNSVITTYNQNISRYLSTIDEYRQDLNIARNHGNPTSIPSTPIRPRRHIRPRSSPMRHNTNTSFPQTPIYGTTQSTTFTSPTSLFSNIFSLPIPSNPIRQYEDVIVSPTQQEISNAVEIFNYSEDNPSPHRRCPITMDEFNMDDRVTRIRQCGHMFHEDAINNWFRVNVRCPVCRYDIREYTNATTRTSVDTSNNTTNAQDQSIDQLTNQITMEITNMLTQSLGSSAQTTTNDVSQNSVFTFDIPITITSSYENEYDEDDEIEDIEDVE